MNTSHEMLTPKQEAFAIAVAFGKSQADAYRAAFNAGSMKPETIHSKASVLMRNSKVTARVATLREPAAIAAQIMLETHLDDLQSIRDYAIAEKQYGAAVSAEIARGKAAALYVEKVEAVVGPRVVVYLPDNGHGSP